MTSDFTPVAPWPMPARQECVFYTCMDYPDGESVETVNWDIRGRFDDYIGHYPLAGKTVLDVGTASGFLAFSAEDAGAAQVTALELSHSREMNRIPFKGTRYSDDRRRWIADTEHFMTGLKKSFWYGWHKRQSRVEMVYAPAADLWAWDRKFDVVIAGAIVEHLSDPVPFLASLAGIAKEAVIVAFTPVVDSEEQLMRTMNDWDNPVFNYSWWQLSLGLYRRIFGNLGFSVELTRASALCHEYDPPLQVEQPTLIARRLPA